MKTMIFLGGILFYVLSCHRATAQPPVPAAMPDKPALFHRLPEQFSISTIAIQKIFSGTTGNFIKIPSEGFGYLEGYVNEKVQRSSGVFTINITLTNYEQALFTISRISEKRGKELYTGRILHRNFSDVLVLVQENDKLYLKKEKQSLFLVE